jgi:hypothetical protein
MALSLGVDAVPLSPGESSQLNAPASMVEVHGLRQPEAVLVFTGVEAPAKRQSRHARFF